MTRITPQALDQWRVVPRLLIALYGYICWETHQWFIALDDPTNPQQLYASVIWGAAAAWFGFYTKTGRKGGPGEE